MKQRPDVSAPTRYEICVNGRLGPQGAIWFEGMEIVVKDTSPPQTIIRGDVQDQAALYGLISRARDLGLRLVSIRPVGPEEGEE